MRSHHKQKQKRREDEYQKGECVGKRLKADTHACATKKKENRKTKEDEIATNPDMS